MEKPKAIEILKGAIMLEKKGKAFYQHMARHAGSESARRVFEIMSNEEDSHVMILSKQYLALEATGAFQPMETPDRSPDFSEDILCEAVKKEVAAAGVESAAISASMAMEERAVKFYSDRAAAAADPSEIKIYQWLADWEKTHLHLLARIERDLAESVWFDNQFWPH